MPGTAPDMDELVSALDSMAEGYDKLALINDGREAYNQGFAAGIRLAVTAIKGPEFCGPTESISPTNL